MDETFLSLKCLTSKTSALFNKLLHTFQTCSSPSIPLSWHFLIFKQQCALFYNIIVFSTYKARLHSNISAVHKTSSPEQTLLDYIASLLTKTFLGISLSLPLYILPTAYSVLTSRVTTFNQNTSESEASYYYTRIQAYQGCPGKTRKYGPSTSEASTVATVLFTQTRAGTNIGNRIPLEFSKWSPRNFLGGPVLSLAFPMQGTQG